MIWKLALTLLALFQSSERNGWENPSNVGPQSAEEMILARTALQGDHIGGDILVDERQSGDGIQNTRFRWLGYPGKGIVPYVINRNLDSLKPLITQAMAQYHQRTCIQFVPKNNTHRDWIELTKGVGCNSFVGRQGGKQIVNLGTGCEYVGTIVHELGHAIGLHHEHQRSDRNRYLTVYEDNIIPKWKFAFNRTKTSDEIILSSYDYSSIMHYGNYAFSKSPGKLVTMAARTGQKLLEPYDKRGFTDTDVSTIQKLYKC